MVTFYQFVQPALHRLMGCAEVKAPRTFKVAAASRFRKRPGRTEFQRAVLESAPDGTPVVRSTGQQGSGILNSMSMANCFVVLAEDSASVEAGSLVDVQPFFGLL
jgi:molybdopterin molybdotransferase